MGENIISGFEELNCWKACREVRKFIRIIIKQFPKDEKFALIDGMKRSSRSRLYKLFNKRKIK